MKRKHKNKRVELPGQGPGQGQKVQEAENPQGEVPQPIVNPKKRIKIDKIDIENLNVNGAQLRSIALQFGMNRSRYLASEKMLSKAEAGVNVQIRTLLQTYKKKYKIVGEPFDWDPAANELILK